MNINIKIPGNLFGNNNELKSTKERLERQEKRDNQIPLQYKRIDYGV